MRADSISEQMFLSTTLIETVGHEGQLGSGTGFFFGKSVTNDVMVPFVVTNKHVVENKASGFITLLHAKDSQPDLGKSTRIEMTNWTKTWFGHPDPNVDIAIAPLSYAIVAFRNAHGHDPCIKCFSYSNCPTSENIAALDAIESVTFVGYPNGIWDMAHFLPVARRGTTATPLSVDFCREPKFLIDASVFGGSSGSPVFIQNSGMFNDRSGMPVVGSRFYLVGVITAVCKRDDLNGVIFVPIPVERQPFIKHTEYLDLGVVIKSRMVQETVDAFFAANGVA